MKNLFVMILVFCLVGFTPICMASPVRGNDFQNSVCEKIIRDSTFLIKKVNEDRIYLDEERVCPAPFESDLHELILDCGESIRVSCIQKDVEGYFIPVSLNSLSPAAKEKMFKNVCLDCKHEWCGGAIVFRCPACHSTNIRSNIPNW